MKKLILTLAVIASASIAQADLGYKKITCVDENGAPIMHNGYTMEALTYVVSAEDSGPIVIREVFGVREPQDCVLSEPYVFQMPNCLGKLVVSDYEHGSMCKTLR